MTLKTRGLDPRGFATYRAFFDAVGADGEPVTLDDEAKRELVARLEKLEDPRFLAWDGVTEELMAKGRVREVRALSAGRLYVRYEVSELRSEGGWSGPCQLLTLWSARKALRAFTFADRLETDLAMFGLNGVDYWDCDSGKTKVDVDRALRRQLLKARRLGDENLRALLEAIGVTLEPTGKPAYTVRVEHVRPAKILCELYHTAIPWQGEGWVPDMKQADEINRMLAFLALHGYASAWENLWERFRFGDTIAKNDALEDYIFEMAIDAVGEKVMKFNEEIRKLADQVDWDALNKEMKHE